MYKNSLLWDGVAPDYLQDVEDFLKEWEGHENAILVKTSGSTGLPKKIKLDKKRVVESAKATGAFFSLREGQVLLLNLSPNYIAGKLMLVRALIHKMKIVLGPCSQNPLLNLGDQVIDFAAFVPYQVEAILANKKSRVLFEQIPNVIIGGGAVSVKLEKELAELPNSVYATFGMTESITHFALKNISKGASTYKCLPGVRIKQDERGCLIIEKNKITDKLITNDLVTLISDTEFKWNGRIDHVINSGGIKISPEELEAIIAQVMPSDRYYFCGKKSDTFGEIIVLYIEGEMPKDWGVTLASINNLVPKYSKPKEVVFVPEFQETPTGKVIRKHY